MKCPKRLPKDTKGFAYGNDRLMEKDPREAYDAPVTFRIITGAVFIAYVAFGTACFMPMAAEQVYAATDAHDMANMDHGNVPVPDDGPCGMCYAEPVPASVSGTVDSHLLASLPAAFPEPLFKDHVRSIGYAAPDLPPPIPVRTVVLRN